MNKQIFRFVYLLDICGIIVSSDIHFGGKMLRFTKAPRKNHKKEEWKNIAVKQKRFFPRESDDFEPTTQIPVKLTDKQIFYINTICALLNYELDFSEVIRAILYKEIANNPIEEYITKFIAFYQPVTKETERGKRIKVIPYMNPKNTDNKIIEKIIKDIDKSWKEK